ncbi:MAG: ABC transporter substrate-binding protein, partial [Nocardioidaceae bacterium]
MTDTPRAVLNPTRRDLLRFSGAGLAATALAGCNAFSTDPAGEHEAAPSASSKKGEQAPSLAAQVKKGKLPDVKDRLPDKPMVIKGDETGRYGGDLSLLMLGIGGDRLDTTIGYENLVRYTPDATSLTENFVIANVAESYEVGADGAEYTFKLRPGMKWSDGTPFTADDIVFWYEDVETNREIRPVTT